MNLTVYDPMKLIEARQRKGLSKMDAAELYMARTGKNKTAAWQAIYRSELGTKTSYQVLGTLCDIYGIPLVDVLDLGIPQTAVAV